MMYSKLCCCHKNRNLDSETFFLLFCVFQHNRTVRVCKSELSVLKGFYVPKRISWNTWQVLDIRAWGFSAKKVVNKIINCTKKIETRKVNFIYIPMQPEAVPAAQVSWLVPLCFVVGDSSGCLVLALSCPSFRYLNRYPITRKCIQIYYSYCSSGPRLETVTFNHSYCCLLCIVLNMSFIIHLCRTMHFLLNVNV